MNAGEIYVKLGLDGKKFDQGLSDAKKRLALFAAEIAATLYLVDRFIEKSTNAATRLTNLGVAAGISAQKLKQYGLAAALSNAGISAEEASGQIASFAKNLYSLQQLGQGDAGIFNQLKLFGREIEWGGKSVDQVLGEISEKIQGLDDQTAAMVLAAGGFSPEMLSFFRNYKTALADAGGQFGRTADQIKQLADADKAIARFKLELSDFADKINILIAPAITELGAALRGLGSGNGELNALSVTMKSLATSMQLIAAGIEATFAAAKIAGIALGTGSIHGNEDINAEIRENAKKSWADRWNKIKGMWGGGAPQPPAPSTSGGNGLGLNNWGNLRPVGGNGFRSFSTPQEGMNALVADLRAKISGKSAAMAGKYGSDYVPTLQSLISTYAPPSENNTGNYIDFVSKKTGIPSNRPLNEGDIEGIVRAVVKMEGNKNISVNTTNHVHGVDAENTARALSTELERTLKNALATNNNGAR